MVNKLRRKLLKGTLAGTALLLGHPLISSSIFKEKESFYGMNLTRRMGDGEIICGFVNEFIDYSEMKNFVIHLTHFQKSRHSNKFSDSINGEKVVPDKKYVADLIKKLKNKNKAITLTPAVDVAKNKNWGGNKWRGYIEPNNPSIWFNNYEELLFDYIKLGNELKINNFCVGLELNKMQKYSGNWENIIKKVRKEFKGKITYCANWDSYKDIEFFKYLDYISISAYFPLRKKTEKSTLEGLINSWKIIGDDLRNLSNKFNKEIVFGEIGYRSAEDAATQHEANLNKVDYEEQRLCFKSLDYAIKNNIIPVKKAYLWVNDTNNLNYFSKTRFEIFNKPAEQDIIKYSRG